MSRKWKKRKSHLLLGSKWNLSPGSRVKEMCPLPSCPTLFVPLSVGPGTMFGWMSNVCQLSQLFDITLLCCKFSKPSNVQLRTNLRKTTKKKKKIWNFKKNNSQTHDWNIFASFTTVIFSVGIKQIHLV